MTRDQQVKICSTCVNRQMNLQQGLLCRLTSQKASFQDKCNDYTLNESTQRKVVIDPQVAYDIKK